MSSSTKMAAVQVSGCAGSRGTSDRRPCAGGTHRRIQRNFGRRIGQHPTTVSQIHPGRRATRAPGPTLPMTSTARDPRTPNETGSRRIRPASTSWTAPLTTASLATNVSSAFFFDYNIDFNGHADPQWGVRWQQQLYAERLFRWIPFGGDLRDACSQRLAWKRFAG